MNTLKKSVSDEIFQVGMVTALVASIFLARLIILSVNAAPVSAPVIPEIAKFARAATEPAVNPKIKGRWVVDANLAPDADSRSISQAIRSAKPGDHIEIRPGFYGESVVISKDLTIEGQLTRDHKIGVSIEGSLPGENTIIIYRGKVSLANLMVSHRTPPSKFFGNPIFIDSGEIHLSNIVATNYDNTAAVAVNDGKVMIEHSTFKTFAKSQGLDILGGSTYCDDCTVSNNLGTGVVVSHLNQNARVSEATFRNLHAENNAINGIYVRDDADVHIFGCEIHDNLRCGMEVGGNAQFHATNCKITNNSWSGITVTEMAHVEVFESEISLNQVGVRALSESLVTVRESKIRGNEKYAVEYEDYNRVGLFGTVLADNKLGDKQKINQPLVNYHK